MPNHDAPRRRNEAGEVIRVDHGGWIDGPSASDGADVPASPESAPETTGALVRAYGDRWDITCDGYRRLWSAEQRRGGSLRLLCAHSPAELAAKIDAAEAEREAGS